MSTQAARSIRFTHASPQQGFRLLELSPDLLSLLESDKPPTLYLKSFSDNEKDALNQTSIGGLEPSGHDQVTLCTPTQTFRLRQVHSSNSVHIIQPSNSPSNSGESVLDDGRDPDTVTAIAKCGSTLEMFEWKAEDGGEGVLLAVPFLERILQVYVEANYHLHPTDNNQDDIEMQDASRATSNPVATPEIGKVKEMILRDIPLSAVQCEAGWRDMCAFVLTAETGQIPGVPGSTLRSSAVAFRPSATVRLDVWKRILEGSILQNIDLQRQFLVKDLWTALHDDGEELFPYALFEAVTFNLMELQPSEGRCNPSGFKWASIDRKTAVRWVGETCLEASAPTQTSPLGQVEFMNSWKDLLPENWRQEASLDILRKSLYTFPDASSIRYVTPAERQASKKGTSASANTTKNSRDWHERFKYQRTR